MTIKIQLVISNDNNNKNSNNNNNKQKKMFKTINFNIIEVYIINF